MDEDEKETVLPQTHSSGGVGSDDSFRPIKLADGDWATVTERLKWSKDFVRNHLRGRIYEETFGRPAPPFLFCGRQWILIHVGNETTQELAAMVAGTFHFAGWLFSKWGDVQMSRWMEASASISHLLSAYSLSSPWDLVEAATQDDGDPSPDTGDKYCGAHEYINLSRAKKGHAEDAFVESLVSCSLIASAAERPIGGLMRSHARKNAQRGKTNEHEERQDVDRECVTVDDRTRRVAAFLRTVGRRISDAAAAPWMFQMECVTGVCAKERPVSVSCLRDSRRDQQDEEEQAPNGDLQDVTGKGSEKVRSSSISGASSAASCAARDSRGICRRSWSVASAGAQESMDVSSSLFARREEQSCGKAVSSSGSGTQAVADGRGDKSSANLLGERQSDRNEDNRNGQERKTLKRARGADESIPRTPFSGEESSSECRTISQSRKKSTGRRGRTSRQRSVARCDVEKENLPVRRDGDFSIADIESEECARFWENPVKHQRATSIVMLCRLACGIVYRLRNCSLSEKLRKRFEEAIAQNREQEELDKFLSESTEYVRSNLACYDGEIAVAMCLVLLQWQLRDAPPSLRLRMLWAWLDVVSSELKLTNKNVEDMNALMRKVKRRFMNHPSASRVACATVRRQLGQQKARLMARSVGQSEKAKPVIKHISSGRIKKSRREVYQAGKKLLGKLVKTPRSTPFRVYMSLQSQGVVNKKTAASYAPWKKRSSDFEAVLKDIARRRNEWLDRAVASARQSVEIVKSEILEEDALCCATIEERKWMQGLETSCRTATRGVLYGQEDGPCLDKICPERGGGAMVVGTMSQSQKGAASSQAENCDSQVSSSSLHDRARACGIDIPWEAVVEEEQQKLIDALDLDDICPCESVEQDENSNRLSKLLVKAEANRVSWGVSCSERAGGGHDHVSDALACVFDLPTDKELLSTATVTVEQAEERFSDRVFGTRPRVNMKDMFIAGSGSTGKVFNELLSAYIPPAPRIAQDIGRIYEATKSRRSELIRVVCKEKRPSTDFVTPVSAEEMGSLRRPPPPPPAPKSSGGRRQPVRNVWCGKCKSKRCKACLILKESARSAKQPENSEGVFSCPNATTGAEKQAASQSDDQTQHQPDSTEAEECFVLKDDTTGADLGAGSILVLKVQFTSDTPVYVYAIFWNLLRPDRFCGILCNDFSHGPDNSISYTNLRETWDDWTGGGALEDNWEVFVRARREDAKRNDSCEGADFFGVQGAQSSKMEAPADPPMFLRSNSEVITNNQELKTSLVVCRMEFLDLILRLTITHKNVQPAKGLGRPPPAPVFETVRNDWGPVRDFYNMPNIARRSAFEDPFQDVRRRSQSGFDVIAGGVLGGELDKQPPIAIPNPNNFVKKFRKPFVYGEDFERGPAGRACPGGGGVGGEGAGDDRWRPQLDPLLVAQYDDEEALDEVGRVQARLDARIPASSVFSVVAVRSKFSYGVREEFVDRVMGRVRTTTDAGQRASDMVDVSPVFRSMLHLQTKKAEFQKKYTKVREDYVVCVLANWAKRCEFLYLHFHAGPVVVTKAERDELRGLYKKHLGDDLLELRRLSIAGNAYDERTFQQMEDIDDRHCHLLSLKTRSWEQPLSGGPRFGTWMVFSY